MSLTQTLIGNQRPQQQQVNPMLMAMLSALPQRRSVHLGMNGQPIDPGAPQGLNAFDQMQMDRAQNMGGIATARMNARDALAKEQQARMNGGFIPQPPASTSPTPTGLDGVDRFVPAPQPVAPLHPALNPHVNPSVADQMRLEADQRWQSRGGPTTMLANGSPTPFKLDPGSIAGRYFQGASNHEMEGLYNQLEPGRQPDPAAYSRQAGINQRASQDSLLSQMGQRGSNPFVSRMAPAPRVDRTQPIWKRLKDAGIY